MQVTRTHTKTMSTAWISYLLVLSGVFSFQLSNIKELSSMSDLVNLGQDFSDAQAPEHLRNALINATNSNPLLNQYSSNDGLPRLKEAVAKMYTELLNRKVRPEANVLITAGATEALHVAFHALMSPGDEWIIIEPAYTRYIPIVKLMKGEAKFTALKPDQDNATGRIHGSDWKLNRTELKSLFNKKTKGILLNNPHNPTGRSFTKEDLQFIADLVKKWNIVVICDEAHEWITYKSHKHLRIASFPGMFTRTITIGTSSKSFSVTGWRIGWVYGPTNLLDIMKPIHANTAHSAATPLQEAIAVGLEEELKNLGKEDSFFASQARSAEIRRDRLAEAFLEVGMTPTIPDGGNCMLVNWTTYKAGLGSNEVSAIENLGNDKGIAFNLWMMSKIGLVGVPMSYFYSDEHKHMGEDYIRYCFHKKNETIEEAIRRIRQLKRN